MMIRRNDDLFEWPEHTIVAAIIPIIWAIYLKHTSSTGIQLHFSNYDCRTFICIRNGSNNHVFVDDVVCYKSNKHKYKIYSSNIKNAISLAPGKEARVDIEPNPFRDFIKRLKIGNKETFCLRIKLNTSMGVITTGWIKMENKETSQYGFIFKNNPRANVIRTDVNPVYSEYINPVLLAFIVSSLIGSFLLPYETMASIVVIDLFVIMLFGPFTFIEGFKNDVIGLFICFGLSLLMGLMLVISTNEISYILISAFFFIIIYLEAMICSGGFTINSE